MNSSEQSTSYEATRCRMVADAVPLVAQEEDFSNPQELQIRGLTTFATSLEEARARIDGLLREVDQRLRKGDHQGLVDILDDHPQLVAHPWVRQELVKWLATGRSYRKPGRRRGSVYRCALVVAGIVEELIRRGLAENKERAFCWLADHHYMSYDAAKYQYYQAWNDERFKPILFNLAAESKSVSGQEFFDIHSKAEVLKAGQSITRTLAKLPEGPVTATFFGL